MKIDARSLYRAWKLVREAGRELFTPGLGDELARVKGWSAEGLPSTGVGTDARVSVLEALRAIELRHHDQPADTARVELVATLPGRVRSVTATRDVIRELVRGAKVELLVVGFTMTDREFHELLRRRGLAGIKVTVVGDRASGNARDLARSWPATAPPLIALEDVTPEREEFRRMHGKVLVADRARALLGSANFSAGGLSSNFEFGARIEGSFAVDIHRVVDRLRHEGWLVPVGSVP